MSSNTFEFNVTDDSIGIADATCHSFGDPILNTKYVLRIECSVKGL